MPPKPPIPLPSPSTYLKSAKTLLRSHPPKILADHLSRTPTRLLTQSLQPHLSPSLFPPIPSTVPRLGSSLPLGNHLIYFPTPPLTLMPDGTDAHHCPPAPFTRRMWAGGSLSFLPGRNRLRLGYSAVCVETVDVERTEIKGIHLDQDQMSGDEKVFVYVNRRYGPSEDEVRIEEVRTLVFLSEKETLPAGGMETPKPTRIIRMPGGAPDLSFTLTPDARLLFHFSALSFNAHAIHLDRTYARETEGYPDLLVQGPLLLCLMMKGIQTYITSSGKGLELRGLEYRNLRPVFVDSEVRVCVREKRTGNGNGEEVVWDVWVEGMDGGLAVKGTARLGRRD